LRVSQGATFRRADGLIFLSKYAYYVINKTLGLAENKTAIIPHGVDDRFRQKPRKQRPISSYSAEHPFRLLYVSQIEPYKHQWKIIKAVWKLREEGLPITLDLVGHSGNGMKHLKEAIFRFDPRGIFIFYRGMVPYNEIHTVYHQADIFVFGSSCENMPNVLLEAMASGLPIASSNRGPMPEIMGDGGIYFDPENTDDIVTALRTLLEDPDLREQKAWDAYQQAQEFSWTRCASETFSFLSHVAQNYVRHW